MKTLKIKVKQYGATFSKNNIEVRDEVIKKLKVFKWVEKFNYAPSYNEVALYNNVLKQIDNQYNCNEREFTFSIDLQTN